MTKDASKDDMIKEVLLDGEERMEKTVESLQIDLRTIRTGRASPALVERLQVDYYGVPTPLIQLAGTSCRNLACSSSVLGIVTPSAPSKRPS